MLLSTQYGYLLVVHELDLDKLGEDMRGFKPNTYWISIETRSLFPPGREHLKRFTADRNRTELIIDFPRGCDPDHISCISPHPHGWAVAGRMNNTDDRSEWTTVHDLQLPAQETLNDDDDDGQSKGVDFTPMDVDSSSAARGRPQRFYRYSQCPLSGCPAGWRGPLLWPVVAMRHWAMVDATGRASAGLSRGPVAGIFAA
uniref:Uncharacterized protein n=1 Tax=Plectus sambesii TaxID=2011161 RepID=A0A914V4N3_9BILA